MKLSIIYKKVQAKMKIFLVNKMINNNLLDSINNNLFFYMILFFLNIKNYNIKKYIDFNKDK